MSPVGELTLSDLVAARVAAERTRGQSSEIAAYRRRKYDALASVFAAEGSDSRARSFPMEPLFETSLRLLATLQSPFAGYLEAPRHVTALYQLHGPALADHIDGTYATIQAFLVDAYAVLWDIAPDQTVPATVLDELGPDPEAGRGWSEWDDLS